MRQRRGSALALLTGLALAASGLATQPAAAATAPDCGTTYGFASDETFFTTASLGSTVSPGEVAKCRMIQVFDADFPAGTQAWQLVYRSKGEAGNAIAVSGTLLIPPAPAGGIKGIVSVASATTGLADKVGNTASCAPSAGIPDGNAVVSHPVADYLGHGYAVAVTDYEGLRTPGPHPYLVGRSAGQTMIDVARAAQRIPYAGLAGKPVAFSGYSQGAAASLWAAQLESTYAPELDVRGAYSGSAPVNLLAVLHSVDGALASGLMAYAIRTMDLQYPELGLYSRLDASGRSFVDTYSGRCLAAMVIDPGSWFQGWNALWKWFQNPLDDPRFVARANQNNVPATKPTVPLFMTHGDADGIVPMAPDKALAQGWQAQGANVQWFEVPGGTHTALSNEQGRLAAWDWLADRFLPQNHQ